jgi:hypothetical protein
MNGLNKSLPSFEELVIILNTKQMNEIDIEVSNPITTGEFMGS